MTDEAVILRACDLTQIYKIASGPFARKRQLHALRGVSLDLRRGECLALVGESGCGKSTLASIFLGLLTPTGGTVLLDHEPLASIDRREVTRRVQPVFQDPYSSLNPRHTIGDIVGLPLWVHRRTNAADRSARVRQMLNHVGLPERAMRQYPSQLSGGQRQRVAIARALINEPEIVICDEPTSALDVSVQAQILNLLRDLQSELGLTYLFVSHDLAVVDYLADRVAIMHMGRIVEEADAATLFQHPRHPYTKTLLRSVPVAASGHGLPPQEGPSEFANPLNPPPGCSFQGRCKDVMTLCRSKPPSLIDLGDVRVECHLFDRSEQQETGVG